MFSYIKPSAVKASTLYVQNVYKFIQTTLVIDYFVFIRLQSNIRQQKKMHHRLRYIISKKDGMAYGKMTPSSCAFKTPI